MSIGMSKYVRILSGVGGSNAVRRRDLMLRIFTESTLASPDAVLEFDGSAAVGKYFGIGTSEHLMSQRYFSYISPLISRPQKISFARDQSTPSKPTTIGRQAQYSLSALKAASGTVSVTIGPDTFTTATPVSFASATTFSDVASTLQAALRAISSAPAVLATITVAYEPTGPGFVVVGGSNSASSIVFVPGSIPTDAMGLTGPGAAAIAGVVKALTPAESVAAADDISNNYGTFEFVRELDTDDIVSTAIANAEKNVQFEYVVPVIFSQAAVLSAALMDIASVSLVLVADNNVEFDEVTPAAIKAAVNYDKKNSVVSYMYRQMPGLTPKITTTPDSDLMDNLRVNYYGQTQTAGQKINFYQRGVMMGTATDPVDQNIHANEQWLKDDAAAGFLQLQISLGRVSANTVGINKIVNTLQATIDKATNNGTISIGKELDTDQKVYITEQSGDDTTWIQVQNIGYWATCKAERYDTPDGRIEYRAVYTLIYSKDDTIRRVDGTHILI